MATGGIYPPEGSLPPPAEPGITAYHASPYAFERFDPTKLGSGQGAAAFGHGFYFAANPEVMEQYYDEFKSHPAIGPALYGGKPLNPHNPAHLAAQALHLASGDRQGAIEHLRRLDSLSGGSHPMAREAAQHLEQGAHLPERTNPSGPHRYEVGLTADHDDFLDWDRPFSEQSPKVQKALQAAGVGPGNSPAEKEVRARLAKLMGQGLDDNQTSHAIYDELQAEYHREPTAPLGEGRAAAARSPARQKMRVVEDWWDRASQAYQPNPTGELLLLKLIRKQEGQLDPYSALEGKAKSAASDELHRHGVKGIRYLDAGSRGMGGLFRIVGRDGAPLAPPNTSQGADAALQRLQKLYPDAKKQPMPTTHNYVVFDPHIIKIRRRYENGGVVEHRPVGVFRRSGGRVNCEHDVPYLAGESKDGKCTYIDRRVPKTLTVRGKQLETAKYLRIHEEHEHERMHKHGEPYQTAHRHALKEERKAVEADGHDWLAYQAQMHHMAEHVTEPEKVTHPPPDLDTKPYPPKKAAQLKAKARPSHFKGGKVPATSKAQARLMNAVEHNPAFAKKAGIPQSVGKEFGVSGKAYQKLPARIGKADGGGVNPPTVREMLGYDLPAYAEQQNIIPGSVEPALQKNLLGSPGRVNYARHAVTRMPLTQRMPGGKTKILGHTVYRPGSGPVFIPADEPHEARGGWIKDWIGGAETFPHSVSYDSKARGYRAEHPVLGSSPRVYDTPAEALEDAKKGSDILNAIRVARRADGGSVTGVDEFSGPGTGGIAASYFRNALLGGGGRQDRAEGGRLGMEHTFLGRGNPGPAPTPYLGTTKNAAQPYAPKVGHVGGLLSPVAGRTDHIPLDVPNGAYVLPADVISGLGQGNTLHGTRVADRMFHGTFHRPKLSSAIRVHGRRAGGVASGAPGDNVPIMAAGGEYVIDPRTVASLGKGDIKRGHDILDLFVKKVRSSTIKTLKNLPGPAQK